MDQSLDDLHDRRRMLEYERELARQKYDVASEIVWLAIAKHVNEWCKKTQAESLVEVTDDYKKFRELKRKFSELEMKEKIASRDFYHQRYKEEWERNINVEATRLGSKER